MQIREVVDEIDRTFDRVGIDARLLNPGGSHLAMIEEPAKRWFHATGIPLASKPAEIRSKK